MSTKTLLEEPRAELTALHTLRLLPPSGLIDQARHPCPRRGCCSLCCAPAAVDEHACKLAKKSASTVNVLTRDLPLAERGGGCSGQLHAAGPAPLPGMLCILDMTLHGAELLVMPRLLTGAAGAAPAADV